MVGAVNENVNNITNFINIDVTNYGAIADANYLNPINNKYYKDQAYTILATDNSMAFAAVTSACNNAQNVKIYFPRGHYFSTTPLELYVTNIIVEGDNSQFTVSSPSAQVPISCIRTNMGMSLIMRGIEFEILIEDKTIVNTAPMDYYHGFYFIINIGSINSGKTFKFVNIYNCIFNDNVSCPNSTQYAYHGALYLGMAENVHIHNNVFRNCCGRIIYFDRWTNAFVYANHFENTNYVPNDVANVSTGSLIFRILSSKHVRIYDNVIDGTVLDSPKQPKCDCFFLGADESLIESSDIQIHNNVISVNKAKMDVITLSSITGADIRNNSIYLNNVDAIANHFLYIDAIRTYEYMHVYKVTINDNKIFNTNSTALSIANAGYLSNKMWIIMDGNIYDSLNDITTIGADYNSTLVITNGVIRFNNNKVTKNGIYVADIDGFGIFNYNKNQFAYPFIISSSNIDSVIVNNILTIPSGYDTVIIYAGSSTNVVINDILIDGAHLAGKKIKFVYVSGSTKPTFVYNNSLIKTPNQISHVMSLNETVTLEYISNATVGINAWVLHGYAYPKIPLIANADSGTLLSQFNALLSSLKSNGYMSTV